MIKYKDDKIEAYTDEYFFMVGDSEECDEEAILAILLNENVLFSNEGYGWHDIERKEMTVVLYVNANDLFAWGCADAENLPHECIGELYKYHRTCPKWGVMKWCCKQRNLQPQSPIVRDMKAENMWTNELEGLEKNPN